MENPNYLKGSLKEYLERLASGEPVPGGGSAAALSLSLSAALLSMVAHFTIGKKRYASFDSEAREILQRSESIREEAQKMIEQDSVVYLEYRRAAAMEKGDPQRIGRMIAATRAGNKLLMRIAALSEEILKMADPLLKRGNPYLLSDVACAVGFARAAFDAAQVNVLINLSGEVPLPEKEELKKGLEVKKRSIGRQAENLWNECRERLG